MTMKNYNFNNLTDYLRTSKKQKEALSFADIEKITGEPLPKVAKSNPNWWKTEQENKRAHYWTDAGFDTYECEDIKTRGKVCFIRNEQEVSNITPKSRDNPVTKGLAILGTVVATIFTIQFSLTPNAPIWERFLLFGLLVVFIVFYFVPKFKDQKFKVLRWTIIGVTGFIIALIIVQFIINEWIITRDANNSLTMSMMPHEYKPLPIKVANNDSSVDFYCSDMEPVFDYTLFNKSNNVVAVTSIKLIINEYEEFTEEDIVEHLWISDNPTESILKREDDVSGENNQGSVSGYNIDFTNIGGWVYHDKTDQDMYIIENGEAKKDTRFSVDQSIYLRYLPEIKESGHYKIQLLINYTDIKGQKEYTSDIIDFYYLDETIEEVLKEHTDSVELFTSLGDAFRYRGNYEKALNYYKKALELSENLLGREAPETGAAYNNIGMVYGEQGDYEMAIECFMIALQIREKVLGQEHLDTVGTYNNIAFVYKYQGNYEKALEYYEKALELSEKVLGREHQYTATIYNNIAVVYREQGKYSMALAYNTIALEILEIVLEREHPYIASTYNNIALVYKYKGEYEKALEYNKKALEIREKVLGPEHPETAISYNNIAGVYEVQEEYEKALEYYENALEIIKKALGSEHPNTATAYNNIAGVYKAQGEYAAALDYYERAMEIYKNALGPEHPAVAMAYSNIAGVYHYQGDFDKSQEYYKKAIGIAEKVQGPEHPDTALMYYNLGMLYIDMYEDAEAKRYLQKAYDIQKTVLGSDHPYTINTLHYLELVQ